MGGTAAPPTRQRLSKDQIPSEPLIKKGADVPCASDSLLQVNTYAQGNSDVACALPALDAVRARNSAFRRSAGTDAKADRNYHDICADRPKGRTKCGNSVYDSNSVAAGIGLF
jgi:hypothetical protein